VRSAGAIWHGSNWPITDVERTDWRGLPVARGGYIKRRYGVQVRGELRCDRCHAAAPVQAVSCGSIDVARRVAATA
jgi:hypothetical protein